MHNVVNFYYGGEKNMQINLFKLKATQGKARG